MQILGASIGELSIVPPVVFGGLCHQQGLRVDDRFGGVGLAPVGPVDDLQIHSIDQIGLNGNLLTVAFGQLDFRQLVHYQLFKHIQFALYFSLIFVFYEDRLRPH